MPKYYAETLNSLHPWEIMLKESGDDAAVRTALTYLRHVMVIYKEMPNGEMQTLWEEGDPQP